MRHGILRRSRTGGGMARIFRNEEYEPWHRFWTSHADSLTRKIKNVWPLDPVIGQGVEFLRSVAERPKGDSFRSWLLGQNPDPTMHVAESYVRQVDAMFDRYRHILPRLAPTSRPHPSGFGDGSARGPTGSRITALRSSCSSCSSRWSSPGRLRRSWPAGPNS